MHMLPTADDYWSLSVIGVDRMTRAISGARRCRLPGQPDHILARPVEGGTQFKIAVRAELAGWRERNLPNGRHRGSFDSPSMARSQMAGRSKVSAERGSCGVD